MLTAYEQAKRYDDNLVTDEKARWIITSNFSEIWIYNMQKPNPQDNVTKIFLEELQTKLPLLDFLVNQKTKKISEEMKVSVKAGDIVGRLYKALLNQYEDPSNLDSQHSLNVLCVRLVFCLYAEDSGIFGRRNMFHDFLAKYDYSVYREKLIQLFDVLDKDPIARNEPRLYLTEDLKEFPYVNGGLFHDEVAIEIPLFTEEIKKLLLEDASENFDWSSISPTIFGAVFESTINKDLRHSGGMHYTSIENIHKVIDPLFLDELEDEFNHIIYENALTQEEYRRELLEWEEEIYKERAEADRQIKDTNEWLQRVKELDQRLFNLRFRKSGLSKRRNTSINQKLAELETFQNKLASLTFLDPACGSGNFLTETYISLRRLENRILYERQRIKTGHTKDDEFAGQISFADLTDNNQNPIKVSISQFHGIEIDDFATTVAKTALWIAESQMMIETETLLHAKLNFLPLKTAALVFSANALRIDWNDIIPSTKLNYIIGNPPFEGARKMSNEQKADVLSTFGASWKNVGNLDYVCCWYKKAAEYIDGTTIRAALVSTNSVSQGELVADLWKPLFKHDLHFDFAYRTFRWDSESNIKAHVHCVIIGFSSAPNNRKKIIIDSDNRIEAKNINGYLVDSDNIFVESRNHPLCNVPEIGIGNKPIDGGNYLFTKKEMSEFVKKEPLSEKYFKPWYGSKEFINQRPRYCLWLGECSPGELRHMPLCKKRVEAVREFRMSSKSAGTVKLAERPTRFHVENMPCSSYIIIPRHSSERRTYIPIGFLDSSVLTGDACHIVANGATIYHFGILTSNVHMAWVNTICGRLEMRYRYSKNIVYNNFPWPSPTENQRKKIEQTAQGILDVRAKYPNDSLADLYDPTVMPYDLQQAHVANDRAVMHAYNFPTSLSKDECINALMKLYKQMIQENAH